MQDEVDPHNLPGEMGKLPEFGVRRWLVELGKMREIHERMEAVVERHHDYPQNLPDKEWPNEHSA